MSEPAPPPPGPDDAVITPGIDNPAPARSTPSPAAGNRTSGSNAGSSAVSADPGPEAPTTSTRSTRPRSAAEVRPALIAASLGITAILVAMTVVGLVSDADRVRNAVAVISVVCFFVGAIAFMVAFVLAAGRSRYEDLWFGGAFFLTGGVVPRRARTLLMASLGAQSVVGLLGASLAPFTPVAFVVLVPMAGMGLMSLYGARWGEFSPKPEGD